MCYLSAAYLCPAPHPLLQGFCYGKFEAFALTLVLPTLLLGHLFGGLPPAAEQGLAATAAGLLALFAARKYTQPVKVSPSFRVEGRRGDESVPRRCF